MCPFKTVPDVEKTPRLALHWTSPRRSILLFALVRNRTWLKGLKKYSSVDTSRVFVCILTCTHPFSFTRAVKVYTPIQVSICYMWRNSEGISSACALGTLLDCCLQTDQSTAVSAAVHLEQLCESEWRQTPELPLYWSSPELSQNSVIECASTQWSVDFCRSKDTILSSLTTRLRNVHVRHVRTD